MVDIGETSETRGALLISIFLISFAIAPIFLAPLSEIYGRRVVLRGGNVLFLAFCIGGGFCQTVSKCMEIIRFGHN